MTLTIVDAMVVPLQTMPRRPIKEQQLVELEALVRNTTARPVRPRPSVPPVNIYESWAYLLATHSDGLWYLIKEYSSSGTARTVASRERQRAEGNWEFRHGKSPNGYGVWARNLNGPMVGEDER